MAQNRCAGPDYLAQLAPDLAMDNVTNSYPATQPDINLLDAYRAHLSNIFTQFSGVYKSTPYRALMWTQSLDKGDFIFALPALRIKRQCSGRASDHLAETSKIAILSDALTELYV